MDIQRLIADALQTLRDFLNDCLSSNDARENKRAFLLSYWIKNYIQMLRHERPQSYRRFQRGDVVKVDFGFRIGSEHGGLHYAVILNSNDSRRAPVVTVVPLTSLKSEEQRNSLHFGEIDLGDQLIQKLRSKLTQSPTPALQREVDRLKIGSIALTNQIVTISKVRITDPVRGSSPLAGIRLDSDAMEKIDTVLRAFLFTNN
ncbi:type II toxin-antitoxin system PemK/MazF family toxin [uncultured Selenomonas sp.]|uniref:type II toxin-antitoxin system PemK/MazF family toxin n=1 Tax=uncultured Selenomonas sp. TaxID=159275 RepID=UPI0028E794F0|nr:type II toxin-antitoxin system PemK/MazF family toxin [uncultured Selenomonas sp.]